MNFKVVYAPEARNDLRDLYQWVRQRAGHAIASGYLDRIEAYCNGFATFPHRGTLRDDLAPGLRIVGFERRLAIAFHIDDDTATFDRFLYAGRQLRGLS